MSSFEKVFDDIYVLRQDMRPGWFFNVTLVFGEEHIGVIDTGFENTPEDHIFPFIRVHGRDPSDVALIVNTHRDGDHVRGNEAMKEKTGAPIAIHALEMEAVPSANLKLEEGDTLDLGDRHFTVIHTPGHRPGSICLYDKDQRVLICGDSVCGEREDLIRMDKEVYIQSMRKLQGYDVDTMIVSHPFQPAGKDILVNMEIKKMLEASIEIAEKL
jgi:glyoxylase-like metal-dependent hydrolase (beta-lactamase superfamily II)